MELNSPIQSIKGIGPVFQKKLKKLNIKTARDLLFHFPFRYQDFSNFKKIAEIKFGENCSVIGKVKKIESSRSPRKRMAIVKALVFDETGGIEAIWFNQPYITNVIKEGDTICLSGKVSLSENGAYFSSPIYEKISEEDQGSQKSRIIPVYPETEKLSSRWLRWIIGKTLVELKGKIKEFIPLVIIKNEKFPELEEALWQIHFPKTIEEAERAKGRFVFQELLLIELLVFQERLRLKKEKAPKIKTDIELIKRFVDSLPFKLTNAQRKCAWQILKDMEEAVPMSRLLQGDVGSGKTAVAVIPSLNAVKNGWQVAFMAPTEILAKQHFKEISKMLQPFKVRIALLTGKEDKIISQKLGHYHNGVWLPEVLEISRKKLLEKTAKGEIDILIGTHTLIQDKVKFAKLALIIIDEQHRFGVEQRAKLVKNNRGKNRLIPHFLSMTATPIPRTLALTIYGDLDFSVLDEMPKGRKKIITKIVSPLEKENIYQFIRERVSEGEQAFVVCPRIESRQSKKEKDAWAEVKAVEEVFENLSKKVFPDLKIAMLHGKMKPKEKEKIMKDFKAKKIDILVSTSVIEVGIDVPNATIMMVEGADRFGLAQLHQFRGRVGRSGLQSYCFLSTNSKSKKTALRLKALVESVDGFELSKKDLEIRGPGSLSGAKQWGIPDLAMKNLSNPIMIEKARNWAKKILIEDLRLLKYPLLKKMIEERNREIHFE